MLASQVNKFRLGRQKFRVGQKFFGWGGCQLATPNSTPMILTVVQNELGQDALLVLLRSKDPTRNRPMLSHCRSFALFKTLVEVLVVEQDYNILNELIVFSVGTDLSLLQ